MSELRRAFVAEARRRLAVLESGDGDPAREAHSLRGSAAVLGLAELERLAGDLEQALTAGETAAARSLAARIRPLVEALAEAGPAVHPERAPVPAPAGEHTVLYIEDSRPNALLVERTLRLRGVRMLDARTGADGLRLAREQRPGLVLLDLRLPDMDGAEVLRRLREDGATGAIPVVVLSGGVDPESAEELAAAGVRAVLGKPFSLERLLAIVDDALAG